MKIIIFRKSERRVGESKRWKKVYLMDFMEILFFNLG